MNQSDIQRSVLAALQSLGDIRKDITYTQISTGTYDTDSGTVSTSTISTTCLAVFTNYSNQEIRLSEGRIQRQDMRVLIVPSELNLTPKFDDTLTRDNGEVWKIVNEKDAIMRDPSEALWLLWVRKYSDGA